jgi:alpha-tubulin suppressor-like RCC1 family protein
VLRYAFPDTRYLAIAAGNEHSCALRLDGSIICVGLNDYGQQSPVPTGTFVKIDAGDTHTCAMRANGTVACWGYSVAVTGTPASAFDAFAVGSSNACALTGTAVTCWGNNQYGQSSASPGQYRSVAPGGLHTCAVRIDKSIACWGSNTYGQSTPP